MGLLEYLCERKHPGNVGDITRNKPPVKPGNAVWIIVKFIISVFIIYGVFNVTVLRDFSLWHVLIFIVIMVGYCMLCYNYTPRPDMSNLGLLGGLIDHPFKFTDDMNRILMFASIFMIPGRFVSITIVQTFHLIKRKIRR